MDYLTQMSNNLDNALVHQKNTLIDWIDSGKFNQIEDALHLLTWNAEVWTAAGYNYKAHELLERVRNTLRANDNRHWQIREKIAKLVARSNAVDTLYREERDKILAAA